MFLDVIKDGADPGATLGAAFTASMPETQLVAKGKFLDHFLLSLNGTVSTAAVALETFAGLLNPFAFKAGQETRIQLRARDLIALMAFMCGRVPRAWENTDNTGSDFILGIKIPIQEVIDPAQVYSWLATRVAQTNISVETLALEAVYLDDAKGKKPIIAVEMPYTTAGAAGYTNIGVELPALGKMIGLLIFNTTIPTDGTFLHSIQRVQMLEGGKATSKFPLSVMNGMMTGIAGGTNPPLADVLNPYATIDFRDEPIDLKTGKISFSVDVEAVSEATRFIAVIEKE